VNVLAGQVGAQDAEPAEENEQAAQVEHVVLPALAEKEPAAQAAHVELEL
jgi:hypothetical protein